MSKVYRMGGGSEWLLYRRVFGLLWVNVDCHNPREMTPKHCFRLFKTRWMLQIRMFKESDYMPDDPIHMDPMNPDKQAWMDDLRKSVPPERTNYPKP